jgi:hypothetical protein
MLLKLGGLFVLAVVTMGGAFAQLLTARTGGGKYGTRRANGPSSSARGRGIAGSRPENA